MNANQLSARRDEIDSARDKFNTDIVTEGHTQVVSQEIMGSWKRSRKLIISSPITAPIEDSHKVDHLWDQSPLSAALKKEEQNIIDIVREGDYVAAISDPGGRLLWTATSRYMESRAERLNFRRGGCWNEHSVGTNAVGLAIELAKPVTVFSCEHYFPLAQDWVCYSAPIVDPSSKGLVGVLDLSTTWDRHSPLGKLATIQLAHSVATSLPRATNGVELEIYALGAPYVVYKGTELKLPQRQLEILCLLALNQDGMSLEKLFSALYGDKDISPATLKADVSHLRRSLNGNIDSRPYRLTTPVWADFVQLWKDVKKNNIDGVIRLYRGQLLSSSSSPDIEEWRYCIDGVLEQMISRSGSSKDIINNVAFGHSDSSLLRAKLVELL